MSEYKIPEAMLEAAHRAAPHLGTVSLESALEAAIRYQSENPPVPTDKQAHVLWISQIFAGKTHSDREVARLCSIEWIRRMYLAEPEVPEAIKGMQKIDFHSVQNQEQLDSALMPLMLEVYRRGQASK